jgi:hypothetical protein
MKMTNIWTMDNADVDSLQEKHTLKESHEDQTARIRISENRLQNTYKSTNCLTFI